MLAFNRKSFVAYVLLLLTSCGSASNLNTILFVRGTDKERVDTLVVKAQALHDEGKYEDSLELLESALAYTKNNEAVIELKASNELALGGFGLFELVGKFIDIAKESESSNDTADILNTLSTLVSVGDSELSLLGSKSDLADNSILKDLTVYVPNYPGDHTDGTSARATIPSLMYLNKAIKTVCPLIAAELRQTDGEILHNRYQCEPFKGVSVVPSKSYFIFFMSHLAEVLYFNIVLLYTDNSESSSSSNAQNSSNIFKRISAVSSASSNFDISNLSAITEATTEVVSNVSSIFDTAQGSMLFELMNDLKKAVGSFDYIDGIDASVTQQLNKVLEDIEAQANQANNAKDSISGSTSALKSQLGDSIVSNLNSQVDTVVDKIAELEQQGDLTTEQQAELTKAKEDAKEMCNSMDTLLGDLSIDAPDGCSAL
ncbi:MAG: hypothetical protein HRU09_04155 [Oligoflexales bacterium]|nr:hypothetical protein [Oligoflexales bacterium]